MDIQVSSNFERLLFDLHGRDGVALSASMSGFEATRNMAISPAQLTEAAALFTSNRVDADGMALAMRWAHEKCNEVIDPHTAIGLAAALASDLPTDVPIVTLATAHPAKFRDAVERAIGQRPLQPSKIGGLFEREERYTALPATLDAIESYIADRAHPTQAAA
jgi:threonine synthase